MVSSILITPPENDKVTRTIQIVLISIFSMLATFEMPWNVVDEANLFQTVFTLESRLFGIFWFLGNTFNKNKLLDISIVLV